MTQLVVPVFLPHGGCPHRCSFCDQHALTAVTAFPEPEEAQKTIRTWLARAKSRQGAEVAFYGGSFTLLPEKIQRGLLEAVAPFRVSGHIRSIRVSTRPDGIDSEKIRLLQSHGVGSVELGVQSMTREVLSLAGRNYTPADVRRAVGLLKGAGFKVGVQLMPGLPAETTASCLASAQEAAALIPDMVRIYPALVLKNTGLERQYSQGRYRPLSLERAVALAARMRPFFLRRQSRIIRCGVQASAALESALVAGPFHPAFGELVLSCRVRHELARACAQNSTDDRITISYAPQDLSIILGQKNSNRRHWENHGLAARLRFVPDPALPGRILRIAGECIEL